MSAPAETSVKFGERSDNCPDHCDDCAWGIGGAQAGATVLPLVERSLNTYRSECGLVEVVITGGHQVGAMHRDRFFPAQHKTPAFERMLVDAGVMAMG